jgi:hypothetical protein
MKNKILCYFVLLCFASTSMFAQNCTVNAGIDQSYCLNTNTSSSINAVVELYNIALQGNSAGNIDSPANRLWELVSAPVGASLTIDSPSANTTFIKARYADLPPGVYTFRLGIDCQTGGRTFDSVQITILNVADFYLMADKLFSDMCANAPDTINFVGRPLRAGEVLYLFAQDMTLTTSNANTAFNTNFFGPTVDSVRFSCIYNNTNCTTNDGPYVRYNISNGTCIKNGANPIVDSLQNTMGNLKPFLTKLGTKKIDTLPECFNPQSTPLVPYENLCIVGGLAGFYEYLNTSGGGIVINTLEGSGTLNVGSVGAGGLAYNVTNNWDTVTQNTMNRFEVIYNTNGCFPTFKDTISLYFQTTIPKVQTFSFYSGPSNSIVRACMQGASTLSSYAIPLVSSGTIPTNYQLSTILVNQPSAASASLVNGSRTDSLVLVGNLTAGQYLFETIIEDTSTECSIPHNFVLELVESYNMPILRDTTVCLSSVSGGLSITYPVGTFGTQQFLAERIGLPGANITISDNQISLPVNGTTSVGTYDVRVYPNTANPNACTNNASDTFRVTVLSAGHPSNAGTDQKLPCNNSTTSLAGSDPASSQGTAGFWKFLPSISSNAGAPIVIQDSANRTSAVSGFLDQSTYYFSWNVTDGNTGEYCNLLPDTVQIIYAGTAPGLAQAAQPNYNGCLQNNGKDTLRSTAIVPTFDVQWNNIGLAAGITSPNNTNTEVTGLLVGNTYSFQLVVSNTCGIYIDTVTLAYNSFCFPLMSELQNFSGQALPTYDELQWQVGSEENIANYALQLSSDNTNFVTIQNIQAKNEAVTIKQYRTTNTSLLSAVNYYRLGLIDHIGQTHYSASIMLMHPELSGNRINVHPSPASTSVLVFVQTEGISSSNLQLIDMAGRVHFDKSITTKPEGESFIIPVQHLPRGLYTVKYGQQFAKISLQ